MLLSASTASSGITIGENMKKKIYIDFDGVLNNYSGWNNGKLPKPKDGALMFIEKMSIEYEIWIFTTRDRETVWKWLIRNHFDRYIEDVTDKKEPAYVYIDDRGICFDGDYEKLTHNIKNFQPYWVK